MSRAPKAWRTGGRYQHDVHELVGKRVVVKHVPRFARVTTGGAVVDLRGARGTVRQASRDAFAVSLDVLGGRSHWFKRRDFGLDAGSASKANSGHAAADVVFDVEGGDMVVRLSGSRDPRHDPRFDTVQRLIAHRAMWDARAARWWFPFRNLAPEDIARLSSRLADAGLRVDVARVQSKTNTAPMQNRRGTRYMTNRRGTRYMTKAEAADAFARGMVPYLRRGDAAQYRVAWRRYVDALIADDAALPSASNWAAPSRRAVEKLNSRKRPAAIPGQGDLFAGRAVLQAPAMTPQETERAAWEAGRPTRWAAKVAKVAEKALPFHALGIAHRTEGPGFVRWSIIPLCGGPSGQSLTVWTEGRVDVNLSTGRVVSFPYGAVDEEGSVMGEYQTYDRALQALWSDGPIAPADFGRFWHTEDPSEDSEPTLAARLPGPPIHTGYGDESMPTNLVVEGPVLAALQCVRLESRGAVSVEDITNALSTGFSELRYERKGSLDAGWVGMVPIAKGVVMHLSFRAGRTGFGASTVPLYITFAPIPAATPAPASLVQSARDAEYWVSATWKAVLAAKWDRARFGPVRQHVMREAETILATHSKKKWAAPIKDMLSTLRRGDT